MQNLEKWENLFLVDGLIYCKKTKRPYTGTILFDSHSQINRYVDTKNGIVHGKVKIITKIEDSVSNETFVRESLGTVENGISRGKLIEHSDDGILLSKSDFSIEVDEDGVFILEDGTKQIYDKNGHLSEKQIAIIDDPDKLLETYYYYNNGNVQAKEVYFKNATSKTTGYYKNGEVEYIANSKDNNYDGYYLSYYNNGVKKEEGFYSEGIKHGTWIYYHPNGNKKKEGVYSDGVPHDEWIFYNSDEKVIKKEYYLYGKKHGLHREKTNKGGLIEVIYKNGKRLGKDNMLNRFRFKHETIFESDI